MQVLKNSLWSLILYIFFNVFLQVYSPRPGAENPLVTKFWLQQKTQITLTICCTFQNDLLEFWFYTHFLIILYMYIAPRQGQTNPLGKNFDVNRKLFDHLLQVLKKSVWILTLYTFFNVFPHVYSPRAGVDNPLGTKFWCQQKGLVTCPFSVSFKNIFWSVIL